MSSRDKSGDPDGRRIASRRAQQLSEAGRLAAALRVLVDRMDLSEELNITHLEQQIADNERRHLMRAHGRIEGRSRFRRRKNKGTKDGNPIRQNRPINHFFLDESGTSHPAAKPGSQSYFVLAAVAMTAQQESSYISAIDTLKEQTFGRVDITLHEPDIRHHDGVFNFDGSKDAQDDFRHRLAETLSHLDYTVFAVGIRKLAFAREFLKASIDPYLPHNVYALSLHLLTERYADFLAHQTDNPRGRLTLEAQGPKEDAEHQLAYIETLLHGTQWVSSSDFQKYLETGLRFEPKSGSRPTELADLVARDVFEWLRTECLEAPNTWNIWEPKIYQRGDLKMGKYGIKVFPDSDIRERIEMQRKHMKESY